ncbi:MAG: alcohol dehydrogenase [Anaerolineales bacterium]|nr:alcohol dehydrogenase [Anaerolineales bacterium]
MSNMTAAVLREHGDRNKIQLEQIPIPEPGPGEVRLRVRACALNWLDVGVRRGPKFGTIPLPLIGGGDIAGTIDALGPGVAGWETGDEVLVYPLVTCGTCEFCRRGEPTTCPDHQIIGEHIDGGLAEYTVVPAENLLPKPANLSFTEAAAIPVVFMTAWHMLVRVGKLQAGERALILGAGGGVASAGIQIAHHAGAHVFTTTSTPEKMTLARELGADEVFNYREEDWVASVLEVTNGRGTDLVQDNVGAVTWPAALKTLARNGRLVTCGSHSGAEVEIGIGQIYHRQLSILGSNGGTYQDLASALQLIGEGHLHPVVDTVLPLEEIRDGHHLMEEHGHFGKVVIEIQ